MDRLGDVIGKDARLVVVFIEAESGNHSAGLAQLFAPVDGKRGFPIARRCPDQDQPSRSRILEGFQQASALDPNPVGRWRYGLGQGNLREAYRDGLFPIL